MKLHPFYDVVDNAVNGVISQGGTVFQQWLCHHCGTKQTMELANKFYKTGKCEECGEITDIEQNGCNFMALLTSKTGSKQT